MRVSISLLLLFIFSKTGFGQDTIIQTNGTRIIAVVQEVGISEIKYKKYATRQTSPIYDIAKYQVGSIKYADGSIDIFRTATPSLQATPAQAVPPPQPIYTYTLYAPENSGASSISGAYIYLGGLVSPLNMYNGSALNSYWQGLYSYETGPGTKRLNTSNTQLYSFFMGGTLVFNKVSNWSYEFQFEFTPSKAIQDSAAYPDGSHGSISFSYYLLNDELQYMRALDSTGKFQIGVEASLDVGIISGSENDVLSTTPSYQPGISQEYFGSHFGSHFAVVAKYFVGKSKCFGFEMRAGYRRMNVSASEFDFENGYNGPLDLSGPFISIGLVVRMRAHYCINCEDIDYDY